MTHVPVAVLERFAAGMSSRGARRDPGSLRQILLLEAASRPQQGQTAAFLRFSVVRAILHRSSLGIFSEF